jgi:DNA-binding response OmpR family regulator
MLRQLVRRLRRKIEADSEPVAYIENVAGRGYGLVVNEE